MKYLLDTHTFLWLFAESGRLSSRARKVLADEASALYLSVAAVWELGLKHALGKLELPAPPREYVRTRAREARIELLSILPSHAFRVVELKLKHRDPFDRMMIAQALEEDLTVVSTDDVFARYGAKQLW